MREVMKTGTETDPMRERLKRETEIGEVEEKTKRERLKIETAVGEVDIETN